MEIKEICEGIEARFIGLMPVGAQTGAELDSRAFGAKIQEVVNTKWSGWCAELGLISDQAQGVKQIWDMACRHEGSLLGFDVKTKNLDPGKYSDGGVCSVDNLLQFMVKEKQVFFVIEFGHLSTEDKKVRRVEYIKVAPLHCLPKNIYRVENLGTGQLRLNRRLDLAYPEMDWRRTKHEFFDILVDEATRAYEKFSDVATRRAKMLTEFKANGYTNYVSLK